MSGVLHQDAQLTTKSPDLDLQLSLLLLKHWKGLQIIPDLDTTLAELALGLAETSQILLGSNASINQKVAVSNLILNLGKLLLGSGLEGCDLIIEDGDGLF